jgi:hypothetical protein
MPPAWVDFCWVLVREKCDNVKWISVIIVLTTRQECSSQSKALTEVCLHRDLTNDNDNNNLSFPPAVLTFPIIC